MRAKGLVDALRYRVNKMHTDHTSVLLESLDGPLFEELYLRNLVHEPRNIVNGCSLTLKGELRDE